jgi:outer membrane protein TolC
MRRGGFWVMALATLPAASRGLHTQETVMHGPSRNCHVMFLLAAATAIAASNAFAQAPAPQSPPAAAPASAAPSAMQPAATPAAAPTGASAPAPASTPEPAATPAVAAPAPAASAPASSTAATSFDLAEVLRRGGEPLTADQAAKLAVQSAPTIERARAATEQAREAASEAFIAVYPRIDLDASYKRLSDVDPVSFGDGMIGTMPFSFDTPEPVLNQYMLQARLSYPVSDLFASAFAAHDAAKDLVVVERHREKVQAQSIGLQAREAYYEYARARASQEIAKAGLAQVEAQRKDTQARVEAGTLAQVELMRAEARVAAAAVTLARAEGAVAIARTALTTLLHRDSTQEFAVTESFTMPLDSEREDANALKDEALDKRPELLALRALVSSQTNRRDAHDGQKLPTLSLVGSTELANPNPRPAPFEAKWTPTWSLGAVLTWSPNDFAVADARSGQVGAEIVRTEADMLVFEDAVKLEITRAIEDKAAATKAMEAATTGIAAAEETYRVRREQFQAGVAVATDLVDAEQDLRRARLNLVNAAIDVRIAKARLNRAVGR